MYILNLIKFLLLLVMIHEPVICAAFQPDYCDAAPVCLNKSHILCNRWYMSTLKTEKTRISTILKPLNDFREVLRRSLAVCNLIDLKWNEELATMARETISRLYHESCLITTDYKNTLYFSQGRISTDSDYNPALTNHLINNELDRIIKSINPNPNIRNPGRSWIFSAYSTEIGCSLLSSIRLNCIINGIELDYFNQSFAYKNECNITKSSVGLKICQSAESTCTNHFICTPLLHDFEDFESLTMDFTTIKFILTKFERENKLVAWDNDLQYFADRIVSKTLTENDKCLAREQYVKMSAIYLNGVKYFNELMSNVDSVWARKKVDKKIGCTPFQTVQDRRQYFNLYCLTSNGLELKPLKQYLKEFTDNEVFRIQLFILLFIVFTASISLSCLKIYIRCVLTKAPPTNVEPEYAVYEEIHIEG